jgi:hypothetical protein
MRRSAFLVFLLLPILMGTLALTAQQVEAGEVREVGTATVAGMQITFIAGPAPTAEEMQIARERMGKMMGKEGMAGMQKKGGMAPMRKPTHRLGAIVTDARTGRKIPNLSVTLTATGPGGSTRVLLTEMPGSYGGPVTLSQKGRYAILITVEGPALKEPVEVPFDFEYR